MTANRSFSLPVLGFLALLGAQTMASASGQGDPPYPTVTAPSENPLTPAKAILGKILFWDEQVSSTNTVACGTCHIPAAGGTDPRASASNSDHPGADGVFGTLDDVNGSRGVRSAVLGGFFAPDAVFFPDLQRTGRKTPPMSDAWFAANIFWDGRATSQFTDPVTGQVTIQSGGALESQAVGPPVSNVEMAHQGRQFPEILAKLSAVKPLRLATNLTPDIQAALALHPDYPSLFQAAFGSPTITATRFAMAIASYERTLISDQTPWDAFNAGNSAALTPQQQAGLQVFKNEGNCANCHLMNGMFTDGLFHFIGLEDPDGDTGLAAISGNLNDKGKMKTPSLRNVGLRESTGLFHVGTGSGSTLDQVVAFYNLGGVFTTNIDPFMVPLMLTQPQRQDLIEFLRFGLTDPRMANELPPFDRPTLYSERQGDGTTPTSNPLLLAGSAFPDSQGFSPQMIADQPPSLQHPFFTVGLANGLSGAPAFLLVGALTDGTDPLLFNAIPLVVSTNVPPLVTGVFLAGSPSLIHGAGYTSLTVSISSNPFLVGINLWMQWVMLDDGGLGAATSDAANLTIMP